MANAGEASSTCHPLNCLPVVTFGTGFRETGSFQKLVPGKPNMSQTELP